MTAADSMAVYCSVNRIYRASPKCCWLVPDAVYQALRNASDTAGRPLLDFHADEEVLLGKRILVTPDLPAVGGSPVTNGALLFGATEQRVAVTQAGFDRRAMTVPSTGAMMRVCGDLTADEHIYNCVQCSGGSDIGLDRAALDQYSFVLNYVLQMYLPHESAGGDESDQSRSNNPLYPPGSMRLWRTRQSD